MYMNMPPKFLTCPKWDRLKGPAGLALAVSTAAAVGRAVSAVIPEDRANDIMFQVPFPVASAIMLPPCLKSMLSMRSGTVIKAKEPARNIIRGNIMTRSEGLSTDVVFDIVEAMVKLREEVP